MPPGELRALPTWPRSARRRARTQVLGVLSCSPAGARSPRPCLRVHGHKAVPLGSGQHPWRCRAEPSSPQPEEQLQLPARSAVGGRGAACSQRGLQAVPGTLGRCREGKSRSAGSRLVPGAGPEPGRFTCSLIRARGGEGAGLGERRRVGTGWLSREKRSSTSPASGDGGLAATPGIPGVPYSAPGAGSKSRMSCKPPGCHPG